jgi:PAS domain S-box-containing protein
MMAYQHSVLIVEDERIVAKDLQHTLAAMGYDAFAIASSADEAMSHAAARCPDLVLMDIRIKGVRDGIETAELLRKQFGVPVIYLTAHADDATIDRAKRTTPYGYLMKPVKAAELRSAIEVTVHRHEMEKQLRERERWFATTLRSIDAAVITVDVEGNLAFANPAAEAAIGVALDAAIGRPAGELVRLGDPAQPSPVAGVLAERKSVALHDARLVAAAGERTVSGTVSPVVDGDQLLGAVMVFRDVTDQKRMQQQLEIADRLASLGTLTSGVAHQINNPLAVVLANASYLRAEFDDIGVALRSAAPPDGELAMRIHELSEVHAEISAAALRIGKIVSDLKSFSRPAAETSGAADVSAAISWAVRTTEHEFRHRARLICEVAALPPAVADETRLGQLFVNLLMNAAQAIPPGQASANEVAIRATADGDRIIIEVRDSGPGIARENLGRIFEPFYTTKAIGEGTGLGLSVCHGIVKSVGGELGVESELGKGSTFRVVLRAAPPPVPAPAPAPVTRGGGRRGRILVVDDDAMVHRTIKRLLRDHDLVCIEDGRDAIARIERGERFDVILSDLMMPVMTGIELYQELMTRAPEQARRIVFVTGGALSTASIESFLRSVSNVTLEKPFGMPEIQSLVSRMLESAR